MITTEPLDRDELHPLCLARGIARSINGNYVSGHNYIEMWKTGTSQGLMCQECGFLSIAWKRSE